MAFVVIDKKNFEEALGDFSIVNNPRSNEVIYEVKTDNKDINVRIYSTIDMMTNKTRDKGTDAIKIVFWDSVNSRPIGKCKKILRVDGKTTVYERINSRIDDFMSECNDVKIVDFKYVEAVLSSNIFSGNSFAKSLLDSLIKYKRLTNKQMDYVIGTVSPNGRSTMESQVKTKDPEFLSKFFDSAIDDDQNIDTNTESVVKCNVPIEYPVERIDPDSVNLVNTSSYEYRKYPFDFFNPVQSSVLPFQKDNSNMIISANTSAGKTICAEFLIDDTINRGMRVIYASPLKSLTEEKKEDWIEKYSDKNIVIMTGDYILNDKRKQELSDADIIVLTSEMLDSRTRKFNYEKNFWMKQVGLLIIDESHILTTNRGHAVESGVMRFTDLNKDARVLFLSATMPNVGELGEWLTVLNDKKTEVIFCDWRPVELQMHHEEYKVVCSHNGYPDYWKNQSCKIGMAVDIVKSKTDEKFLVFVHDKNTGNSIVKILNDVGINTHFHNADLNIDDRIDIERQFNDRVGGIRVLVSTSTLAWGRNLPARNVVVVGVHRGINDVDELDIIQMAGRAGRYGIDDEGHVYLIIPFGETKRWQEIFKNPRPVVSVMNEQKILAFHVLSEVMNKKVDSPETMLGWYSRSLSYLQDSKFDNDHATMLVNTLKKMEMLNDFPSFKITNLGKVSALMYFSPYDIYYWYKNFSSVFNENIDLDDHVLSWCIGDIPSNDMGYIPKNLQNKVSTFISIIKGRGIGRISDAVLSSVAVNYKFSGSKSGEPQLEAIGRGVSFDIRRQVTAMSMIDNMYANWGVKELWDVLPSRVIYGVSSEMISLVGISGVGAVRAKRLWAAGIKNVNDVAKTDVKKLNGIIGVDSSKILNSAINISNNVVS